jgi:hypothetical protein
MYRLNGQPFSQNTPKQYFQVKGAAGKYTLNQAPVINFSGEVGFGIMTHDKNSASENQVGVYSIELLIDGKSIYASVWERFFFEHSRSVNSHIDYPANISARKRIQKSFIEPGNFLTLYKNLENRGLINITDSEIHNVQYIIKDAAGNSSSLSFRIKNNPRSILAAKEYESSANFRFDQDNTFETSDFKISAFKSAFYDNLRFDYAVLMKPPGAYSKTHHVHSRLMPINNAVTIWIKPDSTLSDELKDKALIVNSRGGALSGVLDNGFVKADTREFGNYYVTIDTLPPRIVPLNIAEGKVMTGIPKINFKISDNLSGIKTFRATIDGRWVLMEYDAKRATLWHTFDEGIVAGKHQFQLVVSDMKQNVKVFDASFTR